MRRAGVVDVGTNSALLLIAEVASGRPRALVERAEITRLGKGVDATGRLDPDAVERTIAVLRSYAADLEVHGITDVVVVGTSALRDATGSEPFLATVREAFGVSLRVLTGAEEAEHTFRGATVGLDLAGDLCVVDVGGGSTELVAGALSSAAAVRIDRAVSLDVGAVRMTERYVRSDPPSAEELTTLRAEVRRQLQQVEPPPTTACLIGVAGTVTTLGAMELGLESYDSARVHGLTLSLERVEEWLQRLAGHPLIERCRVPGLEPARADVIVGGVAIVAEAIRWAGVTHVRVSDRGVRWGLALSDTAVSAI